MWRTIQRRITWQVLWECLQVESVPRTKGAKIYQRIKTAYRDSILFQTMKLSDADGNESLRASCCDLGRVCHGHALNRAIITYENSNSKTE
jgi:hypothetical protein